MLKKLLFLIATPQPRLCLLGLGSMIGLLAIGHYFEADDHASEWITRASTSDSIIKQSIWLYDYQVEGEQQALACVENNLSGITHNPISDRWFAVTNSPPMMIEINLQGECLQKIPLNNLVDTEALVWISEHELLIVEEAAYQISHVQLPIDETNTPVITPLISLDFMHTKKHKGLEGIAYIPEQDKVLVVKEKSPLQIVEIQGLINKEKYSKVSIHYRNELTPWLLGMEDFSGLHYDAHSGNLLILSDESKALSEITLSGEIISGLELERGFKGLAKDLPQPEGIAMDHQGNLVILSEPNLMVIYKPKAASLSINQPLAQSSRKANRPAL